MSLALIKQMSEIQKTFYKTIATLEVQSDTLYYDLFKRQKGLTKSSNKIITFTLKIRKVTTAQLGQISPAAKSRKIKDDYVKVEIEPGCIYDSVEIDAEFVSKVKEGELEVVLENGEAVKILGAKGDEYIESLKLSILQRANIMCGQALNDGKVMFTDGSGDYIDFQIQAAVTKTIDADNNLLTIMRADMSAMKKEANLVPTLIYMGEKIVDHLLLNPEIQDTIHKLGFNTSNVAKFEADEKSFIIGTFLGKTVKQKDVCFDEDGNDIFPEDEIKYIHEPSLTYGYAGVPVCLERDNVKKIGIMATDWFVDMETKSKEECSGKMFARSGFFPVIKDHLCVKTTKVAGL